MLAWLPADGRDAAARELQSACLSCADLIADRDWATTTLGPCESWPPELRATLAQLLRSPLPMLLLWSTEGLALYNDAYATVLGGPHPSVLGFPICQICPREAAFHTHVLQACLAGETLSYKGLERTLERPEGAGSGLFDVDCWPVPDAFGRPVGVLSTWVETTASVRAIRALQDAEERARGEAARRLEAEERLRQVLTGARAGSWEAELSCPEIIFGDPVMRWDEGYREIYGFPDDAEPSVARWRALIHPDDLLAIDAQVRVALDGGPSEWVQEFRVRHPSRGLRWVHDRVRLRRDASGRPVSLGGLNFDITDRKAAEAALAESESRFRNMADHSPAIMWTTDADGRNTYLNARWSEITGLSEADSENYGWLKAIHPEDRPRCEHVFVDAQERKVPLRVEFRVLAPDGSWRWVLDAATPRWGADGVFLGFVGSMLDINDLKVAEAALAESEARFRNMADHAPAMMWVTDAQGACTYVNRLGQEFTGQTEAEAMGDGWLDAIHPDDREEVERLFTDATSRRVPVRSRYRVRRADGVWRWVVDAAAPRWHPDGRFLGSIGSVFDITDHVESQEAVERARSAAEYAARHDGLTGLPSRGHLRERLEQQLAAQTETLTALLFIDLDEFKSVNDALGHSAGDAVLIEAGQRLRSCLGPGDFLARMSGDEFVVLSSPVRHQNEMESLARKLIGRLGQPFEIEGSSLVIGASVGIALAERSDVDPGDLLKQADIALYRAKAAGRGVFRFFDPELEQAAQERQKLRADLRDAASRGEFRLDFQPVVELGTLRVRGHEALLRWAHPSRGLLGPSAFIDMAEASGAIEVIGAWVIAAACRAAAAWPSDLVVSVNLSPRQFRTGDLVQTVSRALSGAGLPGQRLMVEITESVLLQDDELVSRTLAGLRDLGVRVAIDDFGIGFSSLGYLRRFRVDIIKIDRSFVADLDDNPNSRAILRAVMSLASDLGLSVTAEGIETPKQLDLLRKIGCHFGQGYLFGRPVPEIVTEDLTSLA